MADPNSLVALDGLETHAKNIREITVVIASGDRLTVRFGLADGTTFKPNELSNEGPGVGPG